jgi:hypothetical protein
MKVLGIDQANRVATIEVCYSSLPKPTRKVKIIVAPLPDRSADGCYPALVEGTVAKFTLDVEDLKCSAGYHIAWMVTGASPIADQQNNGATFSTTLPDSTASVMVTVTLTFADDGAIVSDSFTFNPLSVVEASARQFLCKVLHERLKPIPWWEWEPRRLKAIVANYSREELTQAVLALESVLQRLKMM